MKKFGKYTTIFTSLTVLFFTFSSCEDFLNPEQEINITEDKLYDDWYEYRSVEMGLYALQRELAEQIVILGELRGDLLKITDNASSDLVEIYNFNISKDNKYASPTNFFKLISATNNFLSILEKYHPEVLDPESPVTNYDRLYGEALCMRAWAYFNAVRIYGKVPFIHQSLTTIGEVEEYINSSGTYTDSVHIEFGIDGFENDTVYVKDTTLVKKYFDEKMVIDYFTKELETEVKAIGVNHSINNGDNTWEVTIWNHHAMSTLLGQMYLTEGDLAKAAANFEKIVYLQSDNYRYQLDDAFRGSSWKNIFSIIDLREHIYTMWYNKSSQQQNEFQRLFEPRGPHEYMLKPTRKAVTNWEGIWRAYSLNINSNPALTKTVIKGIPGDNYRGYGVSYAYLRNGEELPEETIDSMLTLRAGGDTRSAEILLEDVDTVVWKYSFNKNIYDEDANFTIYRAAGVHLWLAEVYNYWKFIEDNRISYNRTRAFGLVNDGSNYASGSREQLGVRGRVGFGSGSAQLKIDDIYYVRDPYTNEVVSYINLKNNFSGKQALFEEMILEERARELAFEGERFYDLMRIARRRNDPSFLAKRVSETYPSHRQEEIYNLLLNEENWYINYFE